MGPGTRFVAGKERSAFTVDGWSSVVSVTISSVTVSSAAEIGSIAAISENY
jgi:hypothetical protein